MPRATKGATATSFERRIIKAMVANGELAQDVHLFVNIGRTPSLNFGRVTGSKNWPDLPATDAEIARYRYEKLMVDLKTGLSPFKHERLVKAREAMLLAVQTFNMPLLLFKTELFSALSYIAWTYVLHEFYERKGVSIEDKDGNSLLISQILKRQDCPLSKDATKNLLAIKEIRDKVEHKILNSLGMSFYPIFQSNCLNFEEFICEHFGKALSLGSSLSYALQFSKLSIEQISAIQNYDISPQIEAINQSIEESAGLDGSEGTDFRLRVSFSFEKAAKGDANIVFTNNNPESDVNKTILIQKIASDENWPHKPSIVAKTVSQKTRSNFSSHNHTQAWRKFSIRPKHGSTKPEETNKTYCTYNKAHRDYTYSDAWVEKLVELVNDINGFAELKKFQL